MGDLLEDDLELRVGTLQLSTDNANADNRRDNASESNRTKNQLNANPSVLSGADSLSSSTSSFAGRGNKFHYFIIEKDMYNIF